MSRDARAQGSNQNQAAFVLAELLWVILPTCFLMLLMYVRMGIHIRRHSAQAPVVRGAASAPSRPPEWWGVPTPPGTRICTVVDGQSSAALLGYDTGLPMAQAMAAIVERLRSRQFENVHTTLQKAEKGGHLLAFENHEQSILLFFSATENGNTQVFLLLDRPPPARTAARAD